jgi:hypothetical protein
MHNPKLTHTVAAVLAATAVLASGCATPTGPDGPEVTVFRTGGTGGLSERGVVPTGQILNFSLPLDNDTGSSVRLRSVQLIWPAGSDIRPLPAQAFRTRWADLGSYTGLQGDLAKTCPEHFVDHPLSNVVTPPHADNTQWILGISFIITRPSRYQLIKARINYTTDGHRGWQIYILAVALKALPPNTYPRFRDPLKCTHKARHL